MRLGAQLHRCSEPAATEESSDERSSLVRMALTAVVLRHAGHDLHLVQSGLRHPAVVLRTSQTEAAARLAAAGVGVALLPANIVPDDLPALICEPDPPITRRLAAYSRVRMSPAARRLVEALLAHGSLLERAHVATDGATQQP